MFARIFLVLLWWIGMWGLIDLMIARYSGGSFRRAVFAYSSIIGCVLLILWFRPELIENF